VTLDELADQLYALPPEEFTAARDEAARAAKAGRDAATAKAVKALRKPSVAAWLVNLLAAQDAELLEQLLSLGPLLAQAQAQGQGDALRTLGAQRRELVGAVTGRAVVLGGRPVTAAVRDEVAATLEAALADPASADAVRSGRLVRALSYAGFGGVDLSGAVATPPRAAPRKAAAVAKEQPAPPDDTAERIAAAEGAALAAAGRLDDVVRACEQVDRERAAAQERAEQAHEEVARRRAALAEAQAAAQEADAAAKAADKAGEKAVKQVRKAQRAEEEARAELDRLRRT
jgi:hypothetical protein